MLRWTVTYCLQAKTSLTKSHDSYGLKKDLRIEYHCFSNWATKQKTVLQVKIRFLKIHSITEVTHFELWPTVCPRKYTELMAVSPFPVYLTIHSYKQQGREPTPLLCQWHHWASAWTAFLWNKCTVVWHGKIQNQHKFGNCCSQQH